MRPMVSFPFSIVVMVQTKIYLLGSSIIDCLPKPDPSLGIAYFFSDGRDDQRGNTPWVS